jgi:hypothetical protein
MSVDGTNTLYDILKTINDNQYINYQMYFDVNGVFHFKHITMGKDDMVMVDDDIWKYAYISHEVTTDYESLKNDIIVLGKAHTATKYSNDCALVDHTFTMSSASVKREKDHIKLAFTTPEDMTPTTDGEQYYVNLNGYGAYPLQTTLGSLHFSLLPNEYYVIKELGFEKWASKKISMNYEMFIANIILILFICSLFNKYVNKLLYNTFRLRKSLYFLNLIMSH